MTKPTDPESAAAELESMGVELEAMKEIATVLAPLGPEQRRRVLNWAHQFMPPVLRSGYITRETPV